MFGKPPDPKAMEVYNDFNSNLANMFYCVKNRTWEFLRHLGFLPINSRDEFIVIRKFIEKEEFDTEYLKQELELAQHNLSPPEFEDIKEIMQENAKPVMYAEQRHFSNSSVTATEAAVHPMPASHSMCGKHSFSFGKHRAGWQIQWWKTKILRR